MGRVRDPLLRWAFRVGFRVLRVYRLLFRPRGRGVKCLIVRGEEVLLVRHTYGSKRRWQVPGGGLKRGEEPIEAARREMREELGVELCAWQFVGEVSDRIDHRRDTASCFAIEVDQLSLEPDLAEIAEVRWFRRDELPASARRYVRRIEAARVSR